MKVFISGPMAGYENYNKEEFMKAEKLLIKAGYSVFNPAWLDLDDLEWTSTDIMAIDMAALACCDAIYQLKGWENSKGARAEYTAAVWSGKTIINDILGIKIEKMKERKKAKEYKEYLEGGEKPRTEHRFW